MRQIGRFHLRLPADQSLLLRFPFAAGAVSTPALARIAGAAVVHIREVARQCVRSDDFIYAYLLTNRSFSDFHSLQAQYQRRLSHGLQALLSYTFGKSLDNASDLTISSTPTC